VSSIGLKDFRSCELCAKFAVIVMVSHAILHGLIVSLSLVKLEYFTE